MIPEAIFDLFLGHSGKIQLQLNVHHSKYFILNFRPTKQKAVLTTDKKSTVFLSCTAGAVEVGAQGVQLRTLFLASGL